MMMETRSLLNCSTIETRHTLRDFQDALESCLEYITQKQLILACQ
nr:MAG TPA: hypothetical protein [Caudoviricetes sp.]